MAATEETRMQTLTAHDQVTNLLLLLRSYAHDIDKLRAAKHRIAATADQMSPAELAAVIAADRAFMATAGQEYIERTESRDAMRAAYNTAADAIVTRWNAS